MDSCAACSAPVSRQSRVLTAPSAHPGTGSGLWSALRRQWTFSFGVDAVSQREEARCVGSRQAFRAMAVGWDDGGGDEENPPAAQRQDEIDDVTCAIDARSCTGSTGAARTLYRCNKIFARDGTSGSVQWVRWYALSTDATKSSMSFSSTTSVAKGARARIALADS